MSRKTATGWIRQRRAQRLRAFQVLYELNFADIASIEDLRRLFAGTPMSDEETEEKGEAADTCQEAENLDFAWKLVEGTWTHVRELDALIQRHSRNWRIDRIGKIEITLLRLAMFELAFARETPPKVVINEALELARRFGDARAKEFVNGILDAAATAAGNGTLLTGD